MARRIVPVLVALLGAALLVPGARAQVVRTDSSPICNTVFPQCEAKCRQGQQYMFVCSAGNGPNGGPYMLCQCVAPAMPVGPPQQAAKLVLAEWPGSKACNDKTWLNDCTSQMTAQVNGSQVTFTPAVSAAFNEKCDAASGIVIGPKGLQAAMSFPQYPIGLTSTGPDGTLQVDFSATAADDPNMMDWSRCVVTYKIVQGTFLNPQMAIAAQQAMLAAKAQYATAAGAATSGAGAAAGGWSLVQLGAAAAAGLALLLQL